VIATTIAYETYWRFAAERLAIFYRRRRDPIGPWTSDPILRAYRFTNVYRATDRVSQYLMREIQYRTDRSQDSQEVFFRTILFKIFNKIETWEALEYAHGPLSWRTIDLEAVDRTLSRLRAGGQRIYSAAYIMPAPPFGRAGKHSNHLALIALMMADRLADRLRQAPDLSAVYERILGYPGLGRFSLSNMRSTSIIRPCSLSTRRTSWSPGLAHWMGSPNVSVRPTGVPPKNSFGG
jgi:alpha-glutamyl/putrescinyl thymine pyrophosphorylase clade 1